MSLSGVGCTHVKMLRKVPGRSPAGTACLGGSVVTAARTNTDKSEKSFSTRRPTANAVHRRRCLHGLCHGSQWPWLTSAMQAASPEVARARGPLNSLHPLVSSGGANNSVFVKMHAAMPSRRPHTHIRCPRSALTHPYGGVGALTVPSQCPRGALTVSWPVCFLR
jgi:hypothetical protein